jgi:hypothetical protein
MTSTGRFFRSLALSHGELPTSRSRMAALKIAATMSWMTWTVVGERVRVSVVTQAWISLGLMVESRRSPKWG